MDDELPGDGTAAEAVALINAAERPLILACHGITLSGAEREIITLAEKGRRADRGDAARHRQRAGQPSAQPRHDGHARRAWVNTAIQEADLLIALGMRFDESRHRQPAYIRAERQEDSRRHRPAPS